MPWSVARDGVALRIDITMPMMGEWEALLDEVQARNDPQVRAIYLPSELEGATIVDAEMLTRLSDLIAAFGVPVVSPD